LLLWIGQDDEVRPIDPHRPSRREVARGRANRVALLAGRQIVLRDEDGEQVQLVGGPALEHGVEHHQRVDYVGSGRLEAAAQHADHAEGAAQEVVDGYLHGRMSRWRLNRATTA